jgi:spermidine/putrescine transport system substrate-binding protein
MLSLVVLVLVTGAALAQDAEGYNADNISWTCPEGFEGQTLNVYNWATYIGANTVATFEALCGVSVVYDVYDSNESLVARLRQGNPGYDLAFPSDYIVPVMALDEQLVELDFEMLPNYANIGENWKETLSDDVLAYAVPYMWGSTGIAYNTERVSEPVTSWEQFFNHSGPVAWLGDPRVMLSVALTVLGHDPNSVNPDEISAARDFLIEHSSNVVAIAADDGQALLERGEVDMVVEYAGDIYQLIQDCECDTYAYVIPEQGSSLFIDTIVLLADAPNAPLAYAFIDYLLDPYVNADIVNEIVYPTANQAAIDAGYILDEIAEDPSVFPSAEALSQAWFLNFLGDDDLLYYDAWDELLILIGQ